MIASRDASASAPPDSVNYPQSMLLFLLAEDAFDVLNWARREGFKRDKQLAEVVEAFRKTLADANASIVCR